MAATELASFSFQPWANKRAEEGRLQDILARVSGERGHFRDITEASLQEELAADGALELSESGTEDEEEERDDASQLPEKARPATREELFKAKYEMLGNVRAAEQEILMSLDFVSLLLSRDAPRQAQNTVSPFLRDAVPLGTLGADVWKRMSTNSAREADYEKLAANVRIESLQESADNLLAAATRLESNVRKETQYWEQVLSISEEGWNICRIPGQQHRLGVSFGFSESAPEFSRRGLAALNSSSDGGVVVERGIGSASKALQATLHQDGQIIGTSKIPRLLDVEETTLEARIRYARDSLFDEELYHEMIRESRTITSLGAGMQGSTIEVKLGNGMRMSFDLISLDDSAEANGDGSSGGDTAAQTVALAARLLLSQAHREQIRARSAVPAPISDKSKEERVVMPILRPIMSPLLHRESLERLNAYIGGVDEMLVAAHVEHTAELAHISLAGNGTVESAGALMTMLQKPWTSEAKLQISDSKGIEACLVIRLETTLTEGFGSKLFLHVPWREEPYRLDSLEDLASAADAKLATLLARSLVNDMDGEWKCKDNEALVTQDVGPMRKGQAIWVTVDSRRRTLSLNSLSKEMSWRGEGEKSEKGLWEAVGEVL
ncbi:subunit 17 of mediator complex-domain-containing protein [Neohortaea acidophila]|uniref:Mediator of RNA polymerase II transcription subunit 17 n=1 Tax=Neohortaea acidophila TaxID=245834 RepID=A0A6A6Q695_9PEZI|nr:subunit 17 of mediator complex-domain-containing protein [Neohortaea acidophila]KAF2487958.1 subunit 17 of mediator complex-domain-containing protein [Neohortaea acidophila]